MVPIYPFCGHAKGNYGLFHPKCGGLSNAQTLLTLLLVWISSVMVHSKVVCTRLTLVTSATKKGGVFGTYNNVETCFVIKPKPTKKKGGGVARPLMDCILGAGGGRRRWSRERPCHTHVIRGGCTSGDQTAVN